MINNSSPFQEGLDRRSETLQPFQSFGIQQTQSPSAQYNTMSNNVHYESMARS